MCVGGNDNGDAHDESCSVFSSLAWPSEVGVTYLLCVHGKFVATTNATSVELHVNKDMSDNFVQEGVPESGSFRLTLEETVMNDFCEGALFVEANGVVVQGSTDGATSDTQVPYCHGTESTAPGVWYVIVGVGLCGLSFFDCLDHGPCDCMNSEGLLMKACDHVTIPLLLGIV